MTPNVYLRTNVHSTLYGKGRNPSALNFGDCFSYALAKVKDEVLLFKGNDFSKTDIKTYEYS